MSVTVKDFVKKMSWARRAVVVVVAAKKQPAAFSVHVGRWSGKIEEENAFPLLYRVRV